MRNQLYPLTTGYQEPEANTTVRWQKGEVIGQGAFGTVYLGLNLVAIWQQG